ncbi:MAG: hypothetical protein F9K24_08855 [Leptonema illini]|jgi:ElaB/YqjD/DUF883 family membrane-anchored ribosome-binding protein|uniref:DUF883 domain-containing protein n=1 Tax=Leptonema illini TaxID=183 RepID=A0A833H282_9LEPT|nr:MAG: hypothetical protein F9K24_08855 [Leptonema illini]PKL34461.1 MAG: hypothetical protein CVV45_03070 [Spirochaetae bacterium HGW-Spirochaetae-10]
MAEDTMQQESPGRLKEKVQQARQKAGEEWEHVRERLSVYGEGADEFIDSVGRYIKENPQRSAMIAGAAGLGIGLIAGLLLRGRR